MRSVDDLVRIAYAEVWMKSSIASRSLDNFFAPWASSSCLILSLQAEASHMSIADQ